jgi:hypothetical protein
MMRILAFLLLILAVCCGNVSAQFSGVIGGDVFKPSNSYVGPLDVAGLSSPTYCYSLMACSGALAASSAPLINVRATGTTPANVTCDILSATNGKFGVTANCSTSSYNGTLATTFCTIGGGQDYVVTWYNQSGSAPNVTQSTQSDQEELLCSTGSSGGSTDCLASAPCVYGVNSSTYYTATITAVSQPFSGSCVVDFGTNLSNPTYCELANTWGFGFNQLAPNAGTIGTSAGSFTTAVNSMALTTIYSIQTVFPNSTNGCIYNTNGTDLSTSLTCSTSATGTALDIGYSTGHFREFILWPLAMTSTERTAESHNQCVRWGTSC